MVIDFSDCRQLRKSYNGANGSKISIVYNNEVYMLKFPSKPRKVTELSYANGCISEYVACHIYGMLDIPVQDTILGIYSNNGKTKIVVACKDFTFPSLILQDFGSLKNQIIDSEHQGYGTELADILQAIEEQQVIDQNTVLERFWDMFAVDAFLGNFDRHNGNWGFLYDQLNDTLSLAPVYDCGSCLLPQADKDIIKKSLSDIREMEKRIFIFPTSAIKENGKKINYFEYLTKTSEPGCLLSVLKITNKIDLKKINRFIDNIEYIDDLQKQFYKAVLLARYEKIMVPASTHAKEMLKFH